MALQFTGGDSDRVNFTGPSAISAGMLASWVWFDTSTPAANRFLFGAGDTFPGQLSCIHLSTGNLRVQYTRSGGNLTLEAALANFSAFGTGKWLFVGGTWDGAAGAATDMKLVIGDLSTQPAEPSAYATRSLGSGTGSASNWWNVGNQANETPAASFQGRIAGVLWTTALVTVANMQALWGSGSASEAAFDPATIGATAELWYDLGAMDTTGTVADSSANARHGTITGATLVSDPSFGGGGSVVPLLMQYYHE